MYNYIHYDNIIYSRDMPRYISCISCFLLSTQPEQDADEDHDRLKPYKKDLDYLDDHFQVCYILILE